MTSKEETCTALLFVLHIQSTCEAQKVDTVYGCDYTFVCVVDTVHSLFRVLQIKTDNNKEMKKQRRKKPLLIAQWENSQLITSYPVQFN